MEELSSGAEVCLVNIGPRERRRRLISGVVFLALAAGALAILTVTGAHRLWRLGLALPLYAAAGGYFQARDKT